MERKEAAQFDASSQLAPFAEEQRELAG